MKLGFRWTVVTVVGALFGTILVAAPTSAHPCTVDLKIFDGQKDTSALPEDKEEERGALTVLNRNDTDKDGDKDSTQDNVPGEIDLMKLRLEESTPTSEIAWLTIGGTDKVKLWTSPTKGALVPPDEAGGAMWTVDSLPRTFWVEGVKASATTKDISFSFVGLHSEPQPPPAPPPTPVPCGSDTANATIIWAEQTDEKHGGNQLWGDFSDPPKHALNKRCDGGFGLRPTAPAPRGVANCIGMQFTVTPDKVWELSGVRFDVTRQRQQRTWEDHGQGFKLKAAVDFPAGDVPNDDVNDDEEIDSSKKPTAGARMYSVDGPGPTDDKSGGDRERMDQRFNMKEFVRVRFDGIGFAGFRADGSRCSAKFDWHVRHRLRAEKPQPGAPKEWVRTPDDRNNVGLGHLGQIGNPPGDD